MGSAKRQTRGTRRGGRLTKATPKHISHNLAVELSQHQARPIVVVGVSLVGAIILSLIVLITTTAPFGQTVLSMNIMPAIAHNPWTLSAFLLLLFCAGACLAIIFLAFAKLHLSRKWRYLFGGLSAGGFIGISVLCAMSIAGSVYGSLYFYGMCRGMILIRWPLMLLLGAAFGLSMPVGEKGEEGEKIRHHPRRLRVFISLGALAWMCLLFLLLYLWVPAEKISDPAFALLLFINTTLAGPLLTFFGLALLTGVALVRFFPRTPQEEPVVLNRPLVYCLFYIPVLVVGTFCFVGLLALTGVPDTRNLFAEMYASGGLVYLIFAVSGISFGIGLSQMRS